MDANESTVIAKATVEGPFTGYEFDGYPYDWKPARTMTSTHITGEWTQRDGAWHLDRVRLDGLLVLESGEVHEFAGGFAVFSAWSRERAIPDELHDAAHAVAAPLLSGVESVSGHTQ